MAMKGNENIVDKMGQMLGMEGKPKDAVEILKADHRKVDGLFMQFEKANNNSQKQELVNQIIKELTVHATIEEDLVYPILEDMDKTEDGAKEAYEEHHLLKMALAELADIPMTSGSIKAKVCVIKELVQHHVKEEESELLPQLKKSGTDLETLANQIMQRKQQLMGAMSKGGGIGKNKDSKARVTSATTKSRGTKKAAEAKPRAIKETKATAARSAGTKQTTAKRKTTRSASAKQTKGSTRKASGGNKKSRAA